MGAAGPRPSAGPGAGPSGFKPGAATGGRRRAGETTGGVRRSGARPIRRCGGAMAKMRRGKGGGSSPKKNAALAWSGKASVGARGGDRRRTARELGSGKLQSLRRVAEVRDRGGATWRSLREIRPGRCTGGDGVQETATRTEPLAWGFGRGASGEAKGRGERTWVAVCSPEKLAGARAREDLGATEKSPRDG